MIIRVSHKFYKSLTPEHRAELDTFHYADSDRVAWTYYQIASIALIPWLFRAPAGVSVVDMLASDSRTVVVHS
jgi:hypothetical protein